MLKRQQLTEKICDHLIAFSQRITIMNTQGLFDSDIYAQDIICRLFNEAFDYHLVNLNKTTITVKGIDLGDKENRIAVQVTSENTSTKIKDSIRLFIENKLFMDYDRLLFAFLTNKKDYTATFNTDDKFDFDIKRDVIDLPGFASLVKNLSLEKQERILDILEEEVRNTADGGSLSAKVDLQTIEKQISARCRSKLVAAGITDEMATEIINCDIESNRYSDILDAEKTGKVYIQGEFGSGKSHAVLILCLRMIRAYYVDKSKPIPLYVTAEEIVSAGGVQSWKEKFQYNGSAESYFIFIDGCDEISIPEAEKLLEEVFYLRALWPNVHFLMCGRPLYTYVYRENTYNIPCLSNERVIELISTISGKERNDISNRFHYMESDIRDTLKRPFFSLLYSVLLQNAGEYSFPSYPKLISQFIDIVLSKVGADRDRVTTTLERVAICAIDRNMGKVCISDIQQGDIYFTIQNTGFLFLHRDNTVSFPLPIIAQWFAAEALIHKEVLIDEILGDRMRSSRWRYAFSLMFSKMSFEESIELFSKIIEKDIGSAADIIKRGTINDYLEVSLSPLECGNRIRKCMEIWANAVGSAKELLTPCINGKLLKLAIYVDGCSVTATWSNRMDIDDVFVVLPREQPRYGRVMHTRAIRSQATWPWIYTFEIIQSKLKHIIENRTVLCENDDILMEFAWKTALSLLHLGSLYQEPIPLSRIEEFRKYRHSVYINGRKKPRLDAFFSIIDQMYDNGVSEIHPSVPCGDKDLSTARFVWSHYSEEQLYKRVTEIYKQALQAYRDYSSGAFSSFAPRMRIAAFMPAVFHANLTFREDGTERNDGPTLTWHMEALPMDKQNRVDITLNEPEQWVHDADALHRILENDTTNRPLAHEWLFPSLHSQTLRCFEATPITDVVFQWIEDDLKSIGWM